MNYVIREKCHSKIIAHAAKYAVMPVSGILIGSKLAATVEDCVPLFHSELLPTPSLQASLEQISIHHNMDIVGLYFGNASIADKSLHVGVELVANRIETELGGGSIVLRISPLSETGITALEYVATTWKETECQTQPTNEMVFEPNIYSQCCDFESHLLNTSLNYLDFEIKF